MRIILAVLLIGSSLAALPTLGAANAEPLTDIPALVHSFNEAPSRPEGKLTIQPVPLAPWIGELPATPAGKLRLPLGSSLPAT